MFNHSEPKEGPYFQEINMELLMLPSFADLSGEARGNLANEV